MSVKRNEKMSDSGSMSGDLPCSFINDELIATNENDKGYYVPDKINDKTVRSSKSLKEVQTEIASRQRHTGGLDGCFYDKSWVIGPGLYRILDEPARLAYHQGSEHTIFIVTTGKKIPISEKAQFPIPECKTFGKEPDAPSEKGLELLSHLRVVETDHLFNITEDTFMLGLMIHRYLYEWSIANDSSWNEYVKNAKYVGLLRIPQENAGERLKLTSDERSLYRDLIQGKDKEAAAKWCNRNTPFHVQHGKRFTYADELGTKHQLPAVRHKLVTFGPNSLAPLLKSGLSTHKPDDPVAIAFFLGASCAQEIRKKTSVVTAPSAKSNAPIKEPSTSNSALKRKTTEPTGAEQRLSPNIVKSTKRPRPNAEKKRARSLSSQSDDDSDDSAYSGESYDDSDEESDDEDRDFADTRDEEDLSEESSDDDSIAAMDSHISHQNRGHKGTRSGPTFSLPLAVCPSIDLNIVLQKLRAKLARNCLLGPEILGPDELATLSSNVEQLDTFSKNPTVENMKTGFESLVHIVDKLLHYQPKAQETPESAALNKKKLEQIQLVCDNFGKYIPDLTTQMDIVTSLGERLVKETGEVQKIVTSITKPLTNSSSS